MYNTNSWLQLNITDSFLNVTLSNQFDESIGNSRCHLLYHFKICFMFTNVTKYKNQRYSNKLVIFLQEIRFRTKNVSPKCLMFNYVQNGHVILRIDFRE